MALQFTLALRYLNGRKLRSFLTTLAVMFGVLVIFCMNILLPTILDSFQATMLAVSSTVDLTISQKSGLAFPLGLVDQVAAVDGVRVAHGFLSRPLNLPLDYFDNDPTQPDAVGVINLTGLDPEKSQALRTYRMAEGRFLQPGDRQAVVISSSLADNLGLTLGDALRLPTTAGQVELEIVGIHPPRAAPGSEEILVSLAEAQEILAAPAQINTIEANYLTLDEAERSQIEATIQENLGEAYQLGGLPSSSDMFTNLKLAQSMFTAFGFLALFIGAFIIFNTFRTIVAEWRRDIGMLRAVGANRRTVIGVILTEGFMQGSIGTLAGMGLGYLLAAASLAGLGGMVQEIIHLDIEGAVVSPSLIALTLAVGIGATLLAGLYPALSAGRVTPLEALRSSTNGGSYRRTMSVSALIGAGIVAVSLLVLLTGNTALVSLGGLLFLFGLILLAPALIRPVAVAFGALLSWIYARNGTGYLAQSNMTRHPERVALTASTTMIALAICVMGGEMALSINHGFLGVMRQSLGSDYLLIPPAVSVWANNVGANTSLADELRAVEGVGPVSSLRFAQTKAIGETRGFTKTGDAAGNEMSLSLLGINPQDFPQVAGLAFDEGDPTEAYRAIASGRALIANGPLAANLGLELGDTVPLLTSQGRQDYKVVGVAGDYLNAKIASAYISHANLAQDFNKTEDVFIQLNLEPGADKERTEAAIKEIKRDYPQFSLISGLAYYEQNKRLFDVVFSALYLLFAFLAIPSLIAMLNTLAISVIERTREIGMLRAVGAAKKQVHQMVTAEALLLAAVGTLLGLLVGLYLTYVTINAFRLGGFPVEFYFPLGGVIFNLVLGMLFGLIAALIPARQAVRLEIISALRYE